MAEQFDHNDFEWRVYDGTTPTPNYIVVTNYQLPTFPPEQILPTETIRAGGFKAIANNMFKVIEDDSESFGDQEFTVEIDFVDTEVKVLHAMSNPFRFTPWDVNGTTWTPVLPANIGTRRNQTGGAIAAVSPKHADRLNYLVNYEMRYGTGANAIFHRILGISNTSAIPAIQQGNIRWTFSMTHHGGTDYTATAFTVGTES